MPPDSPRHRRSGLRSPARPGDRELDALVPRVHEELRLIARRQLRRVGAGTRSRALSTDELVSEAYLKLRAGARAEWVDEAHFLGVVAHAMRQTLVDFARRQQAQKRGGGLRATTISSRHGAYEIELDELIALDDALERLGAVDARLRRIVEYLFFGGMTQEQVAGLLGVSTRTVERDWKKAKLFLFRTLHGDPDSAGDGS